MVVCLLDSWFFQNLFEMILESAGLDVSVFFSRQEVFVSISLIFPKYFRYTFRDRNMPDRLAAFWRSDDDLLFWIRCIVFRMNTSFSRRWMSSQVSAHSSPIRSPVNKVRKMPQFIGDGYCRRYRINCSCSSLLSIRIRVSSFFIVIWEKSQSILWYRPLT